MGVNRRGHNSSGSGKSNKHRGIGGNKNKHRGPRHGHANKGKSGGGNAYGTNNINMTISQAKKLYANQLAEGISLQDAMRHNKAETVSYWDLLDDKGDTKKSNSTTSSNTTNNNTMTTQTQTDEEWLTQAYLDTFGRTPDLTTAGGAKYWLDQMSNDTTGGHSRANVLNALQQSAEGKSFERDQVVRPGGVRRDISTVSQGTGSSDPNADNYNPNFNAYAAHFQGDGPLAGLNSANTLNTIAGNTLQLGADGASFPNPVAGGYFQASDQDIIDGGGGGTGGGGTGDANNYLTSDDLTSWWDSLDKSAFTGNQQQSGGMDDFMKFMMLMSVMGGRGGGMMGGGSQYGYGGLNPGGVMQAYDPLAQLQSMGTWFKDNFGSGGATTGTVNTGTAGN